MMNKAVSESTIKMMAPLLVVALALVSTTSAVASSPRVVTLTESNWRQILNGEWMIEFFAPWCPACRQLHPTWNEFSEWSDDLGLAGIAQVDVTENPGLSGRFMVTALPTIFHVKDGEFRQYRGGRDKDSFISFVEDKKWKEMETVPAWKDPSSIQMTLVSYFFKMSMVLRNVHTMITEEMGYPYWVSYAGFALATILLGALLGLILVCLIDCIYPPQRAKAGPITVTQKERKENKSDAEEEDDEKDSSDDLPEDDKDSSEKEPEPVRKRRAKKID